MRWFVGLVLALGCGPGGSMMDAGSVEAASPVVVCGSPGSAGLRVIDGCADVVCSTLGHVHWPEERCTRTRCTPGNMYAVEGRGPVLPASGLTHYCVQTCGSDGVLGPPRVVADDGRTDRGPCP